jgi:hypothetical protein
MADKNMERNTIQVPNSSESLPACERVVQRICTGCGAQQGAKAKERGS